MKKMRKILSLLTLLLLSPCLLNLFGQANDKSKDYEAEDGIEMLLFQEIPVVTASKMEQPISEAPVAISIITQEDIKMSGATQLGEVLSMITGANFTYSSSGSMSSGGIRGFMKTPINKVVLLIDGMDWCFEDYNAMNPGYLPITLEEVARIEILKGPGSSLYGANSMFGVINIITKTIKSTKGKSVNYTGGEYNTHIGSIIYGGSIKDKIDFRTSLSYQQRDNFGDIPYDTKPSFEFITGTVQGDYYINSDSTLNVLGSHTEIEKFNPTTESLGIINRGNSTDDVFSLKYTINDPQIMVRVYRQDKNFSKDGYVLGLNELTQKEGHTKIEFQHTLNPFDKDTLVWGADTVNTYVDASMIHGKHTIRNMGLFADNTYRISDKINLNAGLRYDDNSIANGTYSYRLAALYFLNSDHRLRFTHGTSFRFPDFIETYYYKKTTVVGPIFYEVIGNENLDPERANSYEISYLGHFSKLSAEINAYFMNSEDFIYFYTSRYWPGLPVPRRLDFTNSGKAEANGQEIELRYLFTKWLSGIVNYTHIRQKEIKAPAQDLLTQTPENMANAQLRMKYEKFSANIWVRYVDDSFWRYYPTWGGGGQADAYTITTLYVGYQWNQNVKLSISAFNVFDTKFDGYPIDSQDIGRRITGTVNINF